ncbi:MAG: multidrug efflux SMR transporter [Kutzneria sp.]|nr:multidrug efflux SMR transporter [Kutzneria sp.]MBV9844507.1 multidrug efflux SMR transporter [Kutzneria sp.]
MPWLLLVGAGLFEVAWALSLKPTDGFTRLWPTALSMALLLAAVFLLTIAVRTLPIGTAYAVFTGIGAVGTVTVGIVVAGDPPTLNRLGPIALIVSGVVLLRLFAE